MTTTFTAKPPLLSLFLASLCFGVPFAAEASDPLMDRTGRTLAVTVDGQTTQGTPEREIKDSAGIEAFNTFWTANVAKGPQCFKLSAKDQRLGEPEKIDILIHEVRSDKPFQQWKNYQAVPSPAKSVSAFSSEKGFCPAEYILTERLRYPTLPAGEYVLRIAYWGKGNWDRQDILLSVKE